MRMAISPASRPALSRRWWQRISLRGFHSDSRFPQWTCVSRRRGQQMHCSPARAHLRCCSRLPGSKTSCISAISSAPTCLRWRFKSRFHFRTAWLVLWSAAPPMEAALLCLMKQLYGSLRKRCLRMATRLSRPYRFSIARQTLSMSGGWWRSYGMLASKRFPARAT